MLATTQISDQQRLGDMSGVGGLNAFENDSLLPQDADECVPVLSHLRSTATSSPEVRTFGRTPSIYSCGASELVFLYFHPSYAALAACARWVDVSLHFCWNE